MAGWREHWISPGDRGITQTINKMRSAIAFSLTQSPAIRAAAENAIRGCPARDSICEVRSLYDWTMSHFHYVNDPKNVELLKSPEVSMQEIQMTGSFMGDCDDATALMAALLKSIGYAVRAAVISKPGSSGEFVHVYPVAILRNGEAIPLEMTRPGGFDWEAPHGRIRYYSI
ncbi:MAG: hypothetical protein KGL04_10240 [Elusimicrobia bacterium]|nr:hypothetical protein [Elusimicrobiota bacterium]